MRVAVDGRAFVSPAGGVRRYVSELYAQLAAVPGLHVSAVGAPADLSMPAGCHAVRERPSPPTNLGRHMVGLPLSLALGDWEVYHGPAYVAPVWGAIPTVLSVHDISYESHPEWYPYRRDPLRRWFYRHSSQRARLILTPSLFTADEIARFYGIARARLRVVPLAAGAEFFVEQPPPRQARESILLHVGDLHARRDLVAAVGALCQLVSETETTWRLVLVGRDRGSLAGVRAAARAAGVGDRVEHVETASPSALLDWYTRAFVLIYPSRYEGFGLPVAEAMAAGLPVVAAAAGAVPEVARDGGLLFEPGDVGAAVKAIRTLVDSDTAYAERQAAGRAQAARLSWSRTAAATLEAFREAACG